MKKVKINGKIMEEKLKRGWTISRFAERFQVSEEEFLQALAKNFSPKAYSDMVSRMKKNEKRAISQKRELNTKEEILTPTKEDEILLSLDTGNNTPSLDLLKSQLTALENLLNKKELEHKALVESRLEIRKCVSQFEEELIVLKSRISQCKTDIESLLLEHEEVYQQMQSLNAEISDTKRAIDTLREEIKAKEKITIFVYKSGNFEIESQFDIDISDCWESIYKEIRDDVNLETLTVKDIKVLAKCMAYSKVLKSLNIEREIIFEDENLETFFENFEKM